MANPGMVGTHQYESRYNLPTDTIDPHSGVGG